MLVLVQKTVNYLFYTKNCTLNSAISLFCIKSKNIKLPAFFFYNFLPVQNSPKNKSEIFIKSARAASSDFKLILTPHIRFGIHILFDHLVVINKH